MTRADQGFSGRNRMSVKGQLRSDNITLIPASQLPLREEWAKIAHGLQAHDVLLVVPAGETPLKQVARALVPQLRARGRHVTAIGAHNAASLRG